MAAARLEALQQVERLSERVIRILGGNPGKFTLQGTNTYLVGKGHRRLLIDTGEGCREWVQSIQEVLSTEEAVVDQAILTHRHQDHVGGVPDLLNISLHTKTDTRVFKSEPVGSQIDITDGQVFKVEGATLRASHTPGHTTDHMTLIFEEEDAMFTGDNVLGQGTAVFEELSLYLASLEKMRHQFQGRAYPGHGPTIEDGRARISEYIQHRLDRENQVMAVLSGDNDGTRAGATTGRHWGIPEIVKVLYVDVPENLHGAARHGVGLILEKLEGEGKASKSDSGRWYANTN